MIPFAKQPCVGHCTEFLPLYRSVLGGCKPGCQESAAWNGTWSFNGLLHRTSTVQALPPASKNYQKPIKNGLPASALVPQLPNMASSALQTPGHFWAQHVTSPVSVQSKVVPDRHRWTCAPGTSLDAMSSSAFGISQCLKGKLGTYTITRRLYPTTWLAT